MRQYRDGRQVAPNIHHHSSLSHLKASTSIRHDRPTFAAA
jgi:hypothetical protein